MGTPALTDDTVGAFSASARCNSPCKRPDFVAPGSHLQGLRVPNSYIDATHPEGLIDDRYFRGSGTSEATAIASGAVALILQKYPRMSPDQVKAFFASRAVSLSGFSPLVQGAGEMNLLAMLTVAPPSKYTQKFFSSTGTGTLEGARGQDHVARDGIVLSGEQDIFGKPFNSAAMAKLEAGGNSWSGGVWNGSSWSGNSWSGSIWLGNSWSGNSWSGNSWSGNSWSGNSWSGNSWSGNSWSGNSWSGNSWSGNNWSSDSWMGASWG
jgi:serine protease AprX